MGKITDRVNKSTISKEQIMQDLGVRVNNDGTVESTRQEPFSKDTTNTTNETNNSFQPKQVSFAIGDNISGNISGYVVRDPSGRKSSSNYYLTTSFEEDKLLMLAHQIFRIKGVSYSSSHEGLNKSIRRLDSNSDLLAQINNSINNITFN